MTVNIVSDVYNCNRVACFSTSFLTLTPLAAPVIDITYALAYCSPSQARLFTRVVQKAKTWKKFYISGRNNMFRRQNLSDCSTDNYDETTGKCIFFIHKRVHYTFLLLKVIVCSHIVSNI